jgi:anti-sigma factor RsiW
MTCKEIENVLPAHLEDLLPPEKRRAVEGHLAACPHCRQALADLKMAEEVLHGLDEVEPPPFFEQRIMSQVREVAGKKQSLLRRLFYPLHVKVPIQALATLLIAVLGFTVYQQGGPEMKQMAPLPLPVMEAGKSQGAAGSPAAPSIAKPARQTPAAASAARERPRLAAPQRENGGKADRIVGSRAPTREEPPAVAESGVPVAAPGEKDVSHDRAKALSETPHRAIKKEAGRAPETFPSERKWKDSLADAGAASGEMGKTTTAPAPSPMMGASTVMRSFMEVTLQVGDMPAAVLEIEKRLDQVGARVIARQHLEGLESLQAEIPAQKVASFLDRLEAIGKVNVTKSPVSAPDGNVTIRLKITGIP